MGRSLLRLTGLKKPQIVLLTGDRLSAYKWVVADLVATSHLSPGVSV